PTTGSARGRTWSGHPGHRTCSVRGQKRRGWPGQAGQARARRQRAMGAGLKVLMPGLHTTVQDLGRPGYQAIGVPSSGALDGFSLRLANALVGNPLGAPGPEVLLSGATFEVAADRVPVERVRPNGR